MVDQNAGDVGQGGEGNAPPPHRSPTPPPQLAVRVHRTHISEGMRQFLDRLTLAEKRARNKDIRARNLVREEKRIRREAGIVGIAAPSDDESEIEYNSEDEDAISEERAKKRRQEEEEEEAREAKRPKVVRAYHRPEQNIEHGYPVQQGFHAYLMEAATVMISLPLHLFTRKALSHFNQKGSSLPTTKISAKQPGQKAVYILDWQHSTIKDVIGSEEELVNHTWEQAAGNFMRWCREWDPTGRAAARWQQHFTYLSEHRERDEFFEAILKADIETRNEYVANPTQFSPTQLNEAIYRYKQEILQERSDWKQAAELEKFKASFEASRSRQSSSQRGSSSFRPEGGFPTSRKVHNQGRRGRGTCIRCAHAGHSCGDCTATSLPDGKPCFVDRFGRAGTETVCRGFNIRGAAAKSCQHGDMWKHVCSFCGAADHHALAFHCQKAPSGSA
jgi:hypothetical protein